MFIITYADGSSEQVHNYSTAEAIRDRTPGSVIEACHYFGGFAK